MKRRLILLITLFLAVLVYGFTEAQGIESKKQEIENSWEEDGSLGEDGSEKDRDEEREKDREEEEKDRLEKEKQEQEKLEKEKKEKEKLEKEDREKREKSEKVKKEEAKKKEAKKEEVKKKEEAKKKEAKKEEVKKKEVAKKKEVIKEESIKGEYMSNVSLNIRKGPGIEYSLVGVLDPGKKAVASAKAVFKGITWYKITYKGVTGWASESYLVAYKKAEKVVNKESTSSEKAAGSKYDPYTIYFGGKSVPYKQGGREKGQAIIDGGVYASTWGGAVNFSGNDGLNTHFIAHNPGRFSGMHTSKVFVITDGNGTPFTYHADRVYKVDERGVGVHDGKNYWDRIVGTGGGERVVLQSTYKHPVKWIVEASPR